MPLLYKVPSIIMYEFVLLFTKVAFRARRKNSLFYIHYDGRYPGGLIDVSYDHNDVSQSFDVQTFQSLLDEQVVNPITPRTF